MAHLKRLAIGIRALAGLVALATAATPAATVDPSLERAVKANYLYKFAPFVIWPARAFGSAAEPLTICVAGKDSLGATLEQATRSQRVNGRPLAVRRLDAPASAEQCHILFTGRAGAQDAGDMLRAVAGKPVLTVTDGERALAGGMIQFVLVGGRVRFVINAAVAESSGIAISSKLLGLAVRVDR